MITDAIPIALQMTGVYQTLCGCVLQIIKQAVVIKISQRIYPVISKVLSPCPKGSWKTDIIMINAIKVNIDNAQAGIPAKRDFFAFFSMIVSFNKF